MNLTTRELEGAVAVDVEGKFVGGVENSAKFHGFLKSLINEGQNKIIVNLRDAPWANSQGIGMLISAHTSIAHAGGELVLSNVSDRISDLLTVTKLVLVFKSFEHEDDALKYLAES